MSWGCYRHECDVDADSWEEKERELCAAQAERDGGKTWGSRQVGICPWCVAGYLITIDAMREALEAVRSSVYGQDGRVLGQDVALKINMALNKAREMGGGTA